MGGQGLTVNRASSNQFEFVQTASVTIKKGTRLLMVGQVGGGETGGKGKDRSSY